MPDQAIAPAAQGWAAHLDEGEERLWTGRPSMRVGAPKHLVFALSPMVLPLFLVAFFILAWLDPAVADITGGAAMASVMTLGLFAPVVLLVASIRHRWIAAQFYSLTDRRVVIGHGWPIRRLQTLPLFGAQQRLPEHRIAFNARTTPPSIYSKRVGTVASGPFWRRRYVGFHRIADASAVMAHLQRQGAVDTAPRQTA